jgi:hypothetical protein
MECVSGNLILEAVRSSTHQSIQLGDMDHSLDIDASRKQLKTLPVVRKCNGLLL